MKHITLELEKTLKEQFTFVKENLYVGQQLRNGKGEDGLPLPMNSYEHEMVGWKMALEWVLWKAGCE